MFILQGVTRKKSFQLQSQRMGALIMRKYVCRGAVIVCTKLCHKSTFLCLVIVCVLIAFTLLQLFASAADILWKIGEDGRIVQEFVQLGVKAKEAASEAMDAEAALGEIPDEFLDPIQVHVFFIQDIYM